MTDSQPKVTYLACWWRATWIVFLIKIIFGFLSQGPEGFYRGIGAGLVLAPLSGLFWGWIYWLIKK